MVLRFEYGSMEDLSNKARSVEEGPPKQRFVIRFGVEHSIGNISQILWSRLQVHSSLGNCTITAHWIDHVLTYWATDGQQEQVIEWLTEKGVTFLPLENSDE